MNFTEYLSNAWSTHAKDPKKLLAEFKQNFKLIEKEEDALALARLITHVCGEHLGEWLAGIELLRKLKNHANIKNKTEVNVCMGILTLGNNPHSSVEEGSPSEKARIYAGTAMALANLGGVKNAQKFLNEASEIVSQASLLPEDSANKALAMAGNNIAHAMEHKKELNSLEKDLMISAAQLARKYWEIAGTWIEVERAEYRLAQSKFKAGLLDEAAAHAQSCLDIIAKNKSEPLELFFGYEISALVQKALKNESKYLSYVDEMKIIFLSMNQKDQQICKETLESI